MSADTTVSHGEDVSLPERRVGGTVFGGENLVSPERPRYELLVDLAFAGPGNSGKDKLAEELHRRHGWEIDDGSDLGFQRRGDSHEQGYIKRGQRDHRDFDASQAKGFRELDENTPKKIRQKRLSAIVLAEERDRRAQEINENRRLRQTRDDVPELRQIPAISVLVTARKITRVRRACDKVEKAWKNQLARLARGEDFREDEELITNEPSLTSVGHEMDDKERRTTDVNWAPIHPVYIKVGSNPFSRNLRRPNGGLVHDIILETDKRSGDKIVDKTVEEEADELEARLLARGAIRAVQNTLVPGEPVAPHPPSPNSVDAAPSISGMPNQTL